MTRVTAFVHLTLDGFFAGPRGEIDWFKAIKSDAEYGAYTHDQSESGNTLIFGRTTYEMMKSFWPTPEAIASDPRMARVVNTSPKIVFSKTLPSVAEGPSWKNITLLREIAPADIARRKAQAGADFTILGSGTVVRQFANLGLLDEYSLVIVPIVLSAGHPLFQDVKKTSLELLESRSFRNGLALLRYRPV
ncbi:MAG TPA: dihydrofolate reductase family protein [Thermoanaerobaculia bacterium]|nr:dihydrofolate reductase family protein [Thermoanaerobaculia bacterium]